MAKQGTDIEIARGATQFPISEIGAKLDIPGGALQAYGSNKAKIDYGFLEDLKNRPRGKLILVTAITPTPAGEGKTTTTVGLAIAVGLPAAATMATVHQHCS